jgi:hypothetical protein
MESLHVSSGLRVWFYAGKEDATHFSSLVQRIAVFGDVLSPFSAHEGAKVRPFCDLQGFFFREMSRCKRFTMP